MPARATSLFSEAKRIVKRLPAGDRRRLLHEIAAEECGPRDDGARLMRDALALGDRLTRLMRGRGVPIEDRHTNRLVNFASFMTVLRLLAPAAANAGDAQQAFSIDAATGSAT